MGRPTGIGIPSGRPLLVSVGFRLRFQAAAALLFGGLLCDEAAEQAVFGLFALAFFYAFALRLVLGLPDLGSVHLIIRIVYLGATPVAKRASLC